MISGEALNLETAIAQLNDLRREFGTLEATALSAQEKLTDVLEQLELVAESQVFNDQAVSNLQDSGTSTTIASLTPASALYDDSASNSALHSMTVPLMLDDTTADAGDNEVTSSSDLDDLADKGADLELCDAMELAEEEPASATSLASECDDSALLDNDLRDDDGDIELVEDASLEMTDAGQVEEGIADDAETQSAEIDMIAEDVLVSDEEDEAKVSLASETNSELAADPDMCEATEAPSLIADTSSTEDTEDDDAVPVLVLYDDEGSIEETAADESSAEETSVNNEESLALTSELASEDELLDSDQFEDDIVMPEIDLEDDSILRFEDIGDDNEDATREASSDTAEMGDTIATSETAQDDIAADADEATLDALREDADQVSGQVSDEVSGDDIAADGSDDVELSAAVETDEASATEADDVDLTATEVSEDDDCHTSMHQPVDFDAEAAAEDLKPTASEDATSEDATGDVVTSAASDDGEEATLAGDDMETEAAADDQAAGKTDNAEAEVDAVKADKSASDEAAKVLPFPAAKEAAKPTVRKPGKRRAVAAFTGIAASIAAVAFALQMPEFQNLRDLNFQDLPQVEQILQRLSELQRYWA